MGRAPSSGARLLLRTAVPAEPTEPAQNRRIRLLEELTELQQRSLIQDGSVGLAGTLIKDLDRTKVLKNFTHRFSDILIKILTNGHRLPNTFCTTVL